MIFFFDNSIEDFFCDNEVNFILKDQSKSKPVEQHYFMPIRESINNRILSSSICDLRPPPGFENEPMFSSPLTSSLCQINDSPSTNIPIDEENLQYLVSTWSNNEKSFQQINDLCSQGFDELNLLIQEQRSVQNALNIHLNCNSPSGHLPATNVSSASIFIVPEYLIFKCKKVQMTTNEIFQFLVIHRPDLRLKQLIYAFQLWKESIYTTDLIHREEDESLLMSSFPSDTSFSRLNFALEQLITKTQEARLAFQNATSELFSNVSYQNDRMNFLSNSTWPN